MSHNIITKFFRVINSSTIEKVNDSPSSPYIFLSFDRTNNTKESSSSIFQKLDSIIQILF